MSNTPTRVGEFVPSKGVRVVQEKYTKSLKKQSLGKKVAAPFKNSPWMIISDPAKVLKQVCILFKQKEEKCTRLFTQFRSIS